MCCLDVTPPRNTRRPHRHLQTGTARNDDSPCLPPTHCLPDFPFPSTTVPDRAPTNLPSPRTRRHTERGARSHPPPPTGVPALRAERAPNCAGRDQVRPTALPAGSGSGPRRGGVLRALSPSRRRALRRPSSRRPHSTPSCRDAGWPGAHSPRGAGRRPGRRPAARACGPPAGAWSALSPRRVAPRRGRAGGRAAHGAGEGGKPGRVALRRWPRSQEEPFWAGGGLRGLA